MTDPIGTGSLRHQLGRRRFMVAVVGFLTAPRLARLTVSPSAPPPVRERVVTTFAEATAALDPARAEALATTRAQREYAAVLRLLRERRLDEVDRPLVELARSRDKSIAASAWGLMPSLLTDRTLPRLPTVSDRDQQAFLEALSHTRSAEVWSSSARAARQLLLVHTGDVVFLDVEINGTPARLLLDTGAALTVIGSRLAERVGLRALPGRMKATGVAAGVDARLTSVHLDIGAARIENHPVLLVESFHLEQLSAGGMLMLGGVVGWNAVQGLRIIVDRDTRTLTIERSPRRVLGDTGFFWAGKPVVTVQSENGFAMHFVLDTGTTRSMVSRELVDQMGLGPGQIGQVPMISLDGRRTVEGSAHLAAVLYVGGARLVLPTLWATPPRARPYGPGDGLLGTDALARGRTVIDFGSGEFSISPPGRGS